MDGVNQRAADLQPTWYAATHGETPKSGLLDLLRRGSEETLTESGKVKHSVCTTATRLRPGRASPAWR